MEQWFGFGLMSYLLFNSTNEAQDHQSGGSFGNIDAHHRQEELKC